MPTKTVIAHVRGELVRDGKKTNDVQLRITVNEFYVDEVDTPVSHAIQQIELSRLLGERGDDGPCIVRFDYGGRHYEEPFRFEGGSLRAPGRAPGS